jgi:uncharacterized membrane protein
MEVSMRWEILILRIVHIFSGVFWAGAAFLFAGFIEPTVRQSGAEGGRFVQRLSSQTRYPVFMGIAALLATVSGLWMFWIDSGRLNSAWLATGTGLALATGGVCGTIAAVIGFTVQFRATTRLEALGKTVQGSGAPPTQAQAQEIQILQGKLRAGGRWTAALLVITVLAMATARYLVF